MSTRKDSQKLQKAPQFYSEAFKRQVVSEFERGLFTKAELPSRYNTLGHNGIVYTHVYEKQYEK